MKEQKRDGEERYNVRVLDRAFCVLEAVSDGKSHTLTELSEAASLNTSTTFRILSTLVYHGYVQRTDKDGGYRLGLSCLALARAFEEGSDLRRTALPELERLRDTTKETVHLAVLDNQEVVYLEKLPGLHAVGIMSSRVGRRAPAYCTGLGKALLAYADADAVRAFYEKVGMRAFTATTITDVAALLRHLEHVRVRGYALDQREHEAEVCCVAAPVFDITGEAVAAISLAGPANRLEPLETNTEVISITLRTARAISIKLGCR